MRSKKHDSVNDEERVIHYLSAHPDHSYSARDLARKLAVKKRDFKAFRRILRRLSQQGIVMEAGEGIYQWPSARKAQRAAKRGKGGKREASYPESRPSAKEQRKPGKRHHAAFEVEGTLQQYRGGFAFLIPKDKTDQGDVFVPPGAMKGAMDGDRVIVRVMRAEGQRKPEGQVVRILERRTNNLVGIFRMEASRGRVVPWDHKIQIQPFVSTRNFNGATDGMMVEVEIISDGDPPEGRVVSLLGSPGEPDLDIKIIISKYGLVRDFPREVMEQAEDVAVIREEDYEGRKDFRDWYTVTIDGEKARDFDDAISVTAFKNGSFLLGVHIADVSHYVKHGTAIDSEAGDRGNSVYFPDLVIPMLPEKLSNEMCSLNPQVDRLTMSVVMKVDPDGAVTDYHIYPSVINSNERMTYTAVKRIIEDHDPELLRRYEPLVDSFFTMKKVALLLMAHRRERGSIDFDLPEPEVIIDLTTGKMTGVVKSERNLAHRMIEEFMLKANEIVASHIHKSRLPGMYRVHEPPVPEKIMDFAAIAGSMGYRLPSDAEKIKPKDLQKLLSRVEGKPEERFLNVLLLRSMSRARYSLENTGHFGLALENYTHFTSPIRRYPDLIVHRIVKTLLDGRKSELARLEKMRTLIPEIAEHCSITERRADDAEREFIQLKKVEFMRDKLGDEFEAYISGVAGFGLFVELKDYFIEGVVPLKYMDDDYYVFHEKRHFFKGRRTGKVYRLGDAVKVQVLRVDRERREIDFLMAE